MGRTTIRVISAPTVTTTSPNRRGRVTPGVHALPTQKLTPKRGGTDSHTKYSTATSHTEAMRLEEIARTQVFLKVALLTCVRRVRGRAR